MFDNATLITGPVKSKMSCLRFSNWGYMYINSIRTLFAPWWESRISVPRNSDATINATSALIKGNAETRSFGN